MKYKEPTPEIYKVIYKLTKWKTKGERYFTEFSAQGAFDDFCYAFVNGLVNSNSVTLFDVFKYDRYADKWYRETDTIQHLPDYCKKQGRKIKLIKQ